MDTRTGHGTRYARNLADRRLLDDWPEWIRNRHKDSRASPAPKRLAYEGNGYISVLLRPWGADDGDLTEEPKDTVTSNQRRVPTQDLIAGTIVVRAGKGDCNSLKSHPSCLFVAKDRDWFSDDYVPFKTRINDTRGVWFEAIGIGTVILPVIQSDGECGELLLRNVLHFPDAVCNVVGIQVSEDYEVGCIDCSARVWTIEDGKGRTVAYFEREEGKVFNTLLLSGPPRGARLGSCPFDEKNRKPMFGLHWPESERERFEASRKEEETSNPLSDLERAWLKEHWGNEFKFLAAYELSIYKDEDREEGRAIMRTMMAKEKESRENDHDDSHLVDHYFSDDELEEIELQFGNSKIFLEEELGFSIYNDEHCRVAKRNIREFLGKTG
ncbi:hypothetical protein CEP53_014045 [Fusarium sp. AF-6]|nr:hypothetical protein CEP53_014045 [Fusarium sp. AF-6]